MTSSNITTYFWISLFVGLPLGVTLFVLWARRVWPRLTRSIEGRRVELESIAFKAFVFTLPGLLAMILCSVPVLYFSYQLKQFDYCVEVVRVNSTIGRDNSDLRERCGRFDMDELFAKGRR